LLVWRLCQRPGQVDLQSSTVYGLHVTDRALGNLSRSAAETIVRRVAPTATVTEVVVRAGGQLSRVDLENVFQRPQRGHRVRNHPAEPAECAGVTRSGAAEHGDGIGEANQAVDYARMRAQWCGHDISTGAGEPAVEQARG
jgi:hypothetical protein